MSFGFSGRKEDVSMKLRAQNMKNVRKQTSQLEVDSRQMEERLQELKLAMMNEKEERERNQGVHWQSGQVGKLGNYGDEIVKKTPKSHSAKSQDKKKKVKVLKDEPIVQPERQKGPGTMKHIADRKVSGKENKIKGPKCGQCEEKAAHVSCMECAEEYCASCFAAFHMKGALKKHRSVPIGASVTRTPRALSSVNSTPRPPHEDSSRATPTDVAIIMDSTRSSARSHAVSSDMSPMSQVHVPRPPSSPRNSSANTNQTSSLLQGDYDERQAAMEFQQALAEWRSGNKTAVNSQPQTQTKAAMGQTHGVSMDEGTGTDSIYPDTQPVNIQFHGTLTYAEKLMLKKSRRHQLGQPGSDASSTGSAGSRLTDYHLSDIEVINQHALDEDLRESRVDVGSLLGAVHTPLDHTDPHRSESRVSIIELDDRNMKRRSLRGVDHTSEYEVTELTESDPAPPPTPSALARMKCETLWESRQAFTSPQASSTKQPSSTEKISIGRKSSQQKHAAMETEPSNIIHAESSMKETARQNKKSKRMQASDLDLSSQTTVPPSERVQNKSRPASVQKSYRPESRAKSRNERPQSRAKSRAESRMSIYGEGTLTKQPSSALKEIAQLASNLTSQIVTNTEYRLGLADFFTAGVEPEDVPEHERTLTPSKNRPLSSRPVSARRPKSARQKEGTIEKWAVSNKLYSMTPRSWKPDFSLADTIPDSQVQGHVQDDSVQQIDRLASDAAQEYVQSARGEQAADYAGYGLERLQNVIQSDKKASKVPSPMVAPDGVSSPRYSKGTTSLTRPVLRPTTSSRKSRPNTASLSRPNTASGRESRMIVVDGDDLSRYDRSEAAETQVDEDNETLDQLEWELASQSGRITEDGRISRMLDEPGEEQVSDTMTTSVWNSVNTDKGFDIQNQLRESELMDDFEEMEAAIMEEEEVKRLF